MKKIKVVACEGIDPNVLARNITKREGLKESISIAQVKEVLRIVLDILAYDFKLSDIVRLLEDRRGVLWPFYDNEWDWAAPKKSKKGK